MKKLLWGLIIAAAVLTTVSTMKNDNSIIIYSCMEQFRNDELQKQLNEQFPDLDVFVMYMPTGKVAAKLKLEENETDADMIIALESAYMSQVEDFMTDAKPYSDVDYISEMDKQTGNSLIWERQSGSIVINKKVLEENNLEIPHTYEDLLKPCYKNLIAMPDPKSSGTGFFFLKSLVNEMGEEEAFYYIDRLSENIKQFTESGSGPIKLLKQGEIGIGLALTFQGVNELNEGNDFLILEPEYGCPYSVTRTSLIKGREKNDDIVRVFRFVVNDYMIYDKTYNSPEPVMENQVNRIDNYPQNIKYADMAGIDDLAEKERLLKKWKY